MLEVRKIESEMERSPSRFKPQEATEDATASSDAFAEAAEGSPHVQLTFHDVVQAAKSPKVLHEALERQRNTEHSQIARRFRVQNDCDEAGKRFIAIEVLPRFL